MGVCQWVFFLIFDCFLTKKDGKMLIKHKKQRFLMKISVFLLVILVVPVGAAASLAGEIQKLLSQPAYKKTQFSIQVRRLATGENLFSHHARQPLVPASNMKLITTAAALDLLGADFQYETVFALDGDDLVIRASGDPLTGDPVVAQERGGEYFGCF